MANFLTSVGAPKPSGKSAQAFLRAQPEGTNIFANPEEDPTLMAQAIANFIQASERLKRDQVDPNRRLTEVAGSQAPLIDTNDLGGLGPDPLQLGPLATVEDFLSLVPNLSQLGPPFGEFQNPELQELFRNRGILGVGDEALRQAGIAAESIGRVGRGGLQGVVDSVVDPPLRFLFGSGAGAGDPVPGPVQGPPRPVPGGSGDRGGPVTAGPGGPNFGGGTRGLGSLPRTEPPSLEFPALPQAPDFQSILEQFASTGPEEPEGLTQEDRFLDTLQGLASGAFQGLRGNRPGVSNEVANVLLGAGAGGLGAIGEQREFERRQEQEFEERQRAHEQQLINLQAQALSAQTDFDMQVAQMKEKRAVARNARAAQVAASRNPQFRVSGNQLITIAPSEDGTRFEVSTAALDPIRDFLRMLNVTKSLSPDLEPLPGIAGMAETFAARFPREMQPFARSAFTFAGTMGTEELQRNPALAEIRQRAEESILGGSTTREIAARTGQDISDINEDVQELMLALLMEEIAKNPNGRVVEELMRETVPEAQGQSIERPENSETQSSFPDAIGPLFGAGFNFGRGLVE